MRPLYHPSLEEITVQGILYALSDPVRVRIYAELAQADSAMNCSDVWPSLAIRSSNETTSSWITYSRTKLALMITAPGDLPAWIASAARFGGNLVYYRRNWLRIPIVPHAAQLYAAEWKSLFRKGEICNTLRLSLLPGLATAAALEHNLTGDDKGIW